MLCEYTVTPHAIDSYMSREIHSLSFEWITNKNYKNKVSKHLFGNFENICRGLSLYVKRRIVHSDRADRPTYRADRREDL